MNEDTTTNPYFFKTFNEAWDDVDETYGLNGQVILHGDTMNFELIPDPRR